MIIGIRIATLVTYLVYFTADEVIIINNFFPAITTLNIGCPVPIHQIMISISAAKILQKRVYITMYIVTIIRCIVWIRIRSQNSIGYLHIAYSVAQILLHQWRW